MELTAEKLENNAGHESYRVHVGSHRILSITTRCHDTATKWIKEVQKCHRNKPGPLLVGLSASVESGSYGRRASNSTTDPKKLPYDFLQLSIGSHCLIYHLPDPYNNKALKTFKSFFADDNVIAVGVDMTSVTNKLEQIHEIKVSNPMDLNEMAVQALKITSTTGGKEYHGLARCSLDRLAEVVCGSDVYVIRPESELEWYVNKELDIFSGRSPEITDEKVMFSTLDAYFCYLIGLELLRKIGSSVSSSSASSSSSKKKKSKKKMNKNKK
ncbi:hypothetical protein Vadar_001821 [Vaccinium darrowii]|uniref:Uncharacterized protein n=1 Tax=Vaccinium darrowii TaxID=229202 RepID=A0ACB7YIC3_9ERIC|nr:hypothetical protein Vadar_001821 [Vaccinium darrowii]